MTNETCDELANGPPDGENGEKVLVGCRYEFWKWSLREEENRQAVRTEKNGGIDREVPAYTDRPGGS